MKEIYLNNKHVLVLNVDYQPFNITTWEKAFVKSYFDPYSMSIVDTYDKAIVDSKGNKYPIPSVVCLKTFQKHHKAKLTKKNVFTRDGFECQYCGSRQELTIDHIIPRAMSGFIDDKNFRVHSWTNLVTACRTCNHEKGDKMPYNYKPLKCGDPKQPTKSKLLNNLLSINEVPAQWEPFLERKDDKKKKSGESDEHQYSFESGIFS